MPLYPMTAIQAPILPSSLAKTDTARGKLDLWLWTVEGALALDLMQSPWGARVLGMLVHVNLRRRHG